MAYSLDLRSRVVDFVKNGGSKVEASRRFKISQWCVFNWIKRENLSPTRPPVGHNRQLDWEGIKKHVDEYPDTTLKERAKIFKASPSQVGYILNKMGITVKKNPLNTRRDLRKNERNI